MSLPFPPSIRYRKRSHRRWDHTPFWPVPSWEWLIIYHPKRAAGQLSANVQARPLKCRLESFDTQARPYLPLILVSVRFASSGKHGTVPKVAGSEPHFSGTAQKRVLVWTAGHLHRTALNQGLQFQRTLPKIFNIMSTDFSVFYGENRYLRFFFFFMYCLFIQFQISHI